MNNIDVREFQKYKKRGAYHWEQITSNPIKRNAFVIGRYDNMISLVKGKLQNLQGKKILDVGCGDGVLSYLFAKNGAEVYGIDYSDIAIEFGKEKIKNKNVSIEFTQGSAYELPYEDNYFDAVVSSDVIEHLEYVPTYLKELNRVIKDTGYIVLSTPIKYTEEPLDPEHIIEWFPNEYKKLIMEHYKESEFYYSHSLVLHEILMANFFGKPFGRLFLNIFSLISNPFKGFNHRFKQSVLQYSISRKV